jgi:hypothetical protein
MSTPGARAIVSLTYVSAIDDPRRFLEEPQEFTDHERANLGVRVRIRRFCA